MRAAAPWFRGPLLDGIVAHDCPTLIPALTHDELVSLRWIAAVTTRAVIPVDHIEKLLAAGYVRESVTGLVLTDLGVLRLEKKDRD